MRTDPGQRRLLQPSDFGEDDIVGSVHDSNTDSLVVDVGGRKGQADVEVEEQEDEFVPERELVDIHVKAVPWSCAALQCFSEVLSRPQYELHQKRNCWVNWLSDLINIERA